MKSFFTLIACTGLLMASSAANAQRGSEAPLLSDVPRCFTLVNASGHKSFGSISTRLYVAPDKKSSYFSDNFQLKDGDRKEVCATGPFYPGYSLELRLRSLIPLWTCYVPTNGQEVRILSRKTADGATKMYASCEPTWQ